MFRSAIDIWYAYCLYNQHLTAPRRADSHQAKAVSPPASSLLQIPVHKLRSWDVQGTYRKKKSTWYFSTILSVSYGDEG